MQCAVMRRVVRDMNFPVDVAVVPTVRAKDGLALSSRNAYLNPDQRASAPRVFAALSRGKMEYERTCGTCSRSDLEEAVRRELAKEPLIERVDYVSVACTDSMRELTTVDSSTGAVLAVAVRVGSIRLIDNVILDPL